MKHFFLLTALAVTVCIANSLVAQFNGGQFTGVFVFDHEQQRGYKIVAIDEAPGRTMDARLFATADPDVLIRYMPEGGAPASVTTFVLFAEDTILFDAGLGNDLWVQKLTEAGVKPESVKLVLLTHMHGDHIGGLLRGNERRFPNARVLVATPEYEWWLARSYTPPAAEQPLRVLAAYGTDLATFQFDDIVFENSEVRVKALDASGHTPGHAVFLIEGKGEQGQRLLILGDLLHAAALQFPRPEVCARFDMDHEKAIAARKRILDFAVQEKIPVAGMHFPPPHFGIVEKNDRGGYIFRSDTADRSSR